MHKYNLESFILLTRHTGSVLFLLVVFLIEVVRCYIEEILLLAVPSYMFSSQLSAWLSTSHPASCTGETFFSS